MKLFKIIVSPSVSNNFTKRRHNGFKIRLTHAKEKASEASAKHVGVRVGVGERSEAAKYVNITQTWRLHNRQFLLAAFSSIRIYIRSLRHAGIFFRKGSTESEYLLIAETFVCACLNYRRENSLITAALSK